jgi:hypothetical protein
MKLWNRCSVQQSCEHHIGMQSSATKTSTFHNTTPELQILPIPKVAEH